VVISRKKVHMSTEWLPE